MARGARIEHERIADFGKPQDEILAAEAGTILTDISTLGAIRFSGADAETFLQGQLTCDVREATTAHAQLGGYCTPKGRMLATFLLWRDDAGFCMQLPAELLEGIRKRLAMYVLRSKVKIEDASASAVRLGIAGPAAAEALAGLGAAVPANDYEMAQAGGATLIRLGERRFELLVSPDEAPGVWEKLAKHAMPAGSGCWEWLDIRAGIPMVTAATQEQFVPQMANMEAIGGVSFKKGCYTGQEIVARAQYLGKVKRRMYLVNIQAEAQPQAGDILFGQGPAEQSGGMIVDARPAPAGGYDALAVILNASVEAGEVRWKTADGPPLTVMALPYEAP